MTDKQHSQNYDPKAWCSAEMGFQLLISISLKCLHQRRLGKALEWFRLSSIMQRSDSRILDTSDQEQAKPSNKNMESSDYMALSDRARNYEAKATGFAFLSFFLEFLPFIKLQLKSTKIKTKTLTSGPHLSKETRERGGSALLCPRPRAAAMRSARARRP